MDEKTYLISLDVADEHLDHDRVRTFIRTNPDFAAWWNHIPSLYLVRTRLSADGVSEQVEQYTNQARFLVMEVNLANSQGWLPSRSWEWITRREAAASMGSNQV